MGDKTNIEWTDATWNPIRGCSRISEGCRNCYAEGVANRFKGEGMPYEGLIAKTGQWNGNIKVIDDLLSQPVRWKKPRRIFVNSMSDLFHENLTDEQIDKVFGVMWACWMMGIEHKFQILTKRAKRMHEYMSQDRRYEWAKAAMPAGLRDKITLYPNPHPNIWLGVSVEDQKTADERIPFLLGTPAAVRWISAEPLLEKIDLTKVSYEQSPGYFGDALQWYHRPHSERNTKWNGLDWAVVGGESGKNARAMHPEWVRNLRDQCVDANVPFFFKQWGEHAPNWFNDDNGNKIEGSEWIDRMGKKIAGRTLDGQEWNQYPS